MEEQNIYIAERGFINFETFQIEVKFIRNKNRILILEYYCKDNEGLTEMFDIKQHEHGKKSLYSLFESYIYCGNYIPTHIKDDLDKIIYPKKKRNIIKRIFKKI